MNTTFVYIYFFKPGYEIPVLKVALQRMSLKMISLTSKCTMPGNTPVSNV